MAVALTVSDRCRAAIASRDPVGQDLARLLAEVGDERTSRVLAGNGRAQLGAASEIVLERHGGSGTVLEALASRDDLPVGVVEKLLDLVSMAAGRRLRDRYGAGDFLAPVAPNARERAILRAVRKAGDASAVEYACPWSTREISRTICFSGPCGAGVWSSSRRRCP